MVLLGLALIGMLAGYLISSVRNGPAGAFKSVARAISDAFRDFGSMSYRRVMAMAKLAVKESIRRYVLIVFAVFALILLFAGWYLDTGADNPGRLYISFVMKTTNFLVILLAIFLSAFSLPNDIKSRTIYTVVTKPVRPWEIVIGRILGFTFVGTMILALMGLFSWGFVVRGLRHEHGVDTASLQPTEDGQGWVGRTTQHANHRHEFIVGGEGETTTDAVKGHFHTITSEGAGDSPPEITAGKQAGALEARVPVWGDLRFLNRKGELTQKGINVGKEWTYRGYIEGGTLSAGIWRFKGLTADKFPNGLPIEMTIRVFRTYKGKIERGIFGSMEFINPNPELRNPATRAELDPDTAVKSRSFTFTAQEFTPESKFIDRRIEAEMPDGTFRKVDLFESLVHNGELDVLIRCDEKAQYFGMAKTDVYLRSADNWFTVNFIKGYLTMWLQMVIVISFGVMFSTFLTGSVAMLATLFMLIIGYFSNIIVRVATGQEKGGGPIESAIRIFKQDNQTTPLEAGIGTYVIQAFDFVAMLIMRGLSYLMPNFRDYAEYGGINTARFVASGFDIQSDLMWQHTMFAILYVFIATCAGYFFLKSKEIAA